MHQVGRNFVDKISPTMTKEELQSMVTQLREIVAEDAAIFKSIMELMEAQEPFSSRQLEEDKAQTSTFPEAILLALEEHLKTLS